MPGGHPLSMAPPCNIVLATVLLLSLALKSHADEVACLVARLDSRDKLSSMRNSTLSMDDYEATVLAIMDNMLSVCAQITPVPIRDLRFLIPTDAQGAANAITAQFKAQFKITVLGVPVPEEDLVAEIIFTINNGFDQAYDAWSIRTRDLVDMQLAGAISDISEWAIEDPRYKWSDFPLFLRSWMTVDGNIYGIPRGYYTPYLYYRLDLFETFNLTVPSTWDELVDIAEAWNNTDFDKDGAGDFSLCIDHDTLDETLMQILASFTQYRGSPSSFLFAPMKMEPLVNNPAMAKALRIVSRLKIVSSDYTLANTAFRSKFLEGKCLMTLQSSGIFKSTATTGVVKGKLGVALPPGSSEVLLSSSMQLVPCSLSTCRLELNPLDGTHRVINRAPYSGGKGGNVLAFNPKDSLAYRSLMYNATVTLLYVIQTLSTATISMSGPLRYNEMATDPASLLNYTSKGFDAGDTMRFLTITRTIMDYPNAVHEPRIPGASVFRALTKVAVQSPIDTDSDINTAMELLYQGFQDELRNGTVDFQTSRDIFWKNIGFVGLFPPLPPKPSEAAGDSSNGSSSGLSESHLVPIIVLPTLAIMATLIGLLCYRVQMKGRKSGILGGVLAPLVGPGSTLLITDIESSSTLWEVMPDGVMDAAILLHHRAMRDCMKICSGYESATEGDSFIVSFHIPGDAVKFSGLVQEKLLLSVWPGELLKHHLCEPCWMQASPEVDCFLKQKGDEVPSMHRPNKLMGDSLRGLHLLPSLAVMNSLNRSPRSTPGFEGLTLMDYLRNHCTPIDVDSDAWLEIMRQPLSANSPVLLWQGLRVRIGMHTGIHDASELTVNRASSRVHYSGAIMDVTRAVQGAAQGGMILCSEQTFKQLPAQFLEGMVIAASGEHILKEVPNPVHIYQALNRTLMYRLPYMDTVKSEKQVSHGFQESPHGKSTVCFMTMDASGHIGNKELCSQAMALYHTVANDELSSCQGYLLEAVGGLFLASFISPFNALKWAICTQQRFEKDVLPLTAAFSGDPVSTSTSAAFRLKFGLDFGTHTSHINPVSARIEHRGKVMNRAARILSAAKPGQVYCSQGTWCGAAREVAAETNGRELGMANSLPFPRLGGLSATAPDRKRCHSVSNLNVQITPSPPAFVQPPRVLEPSTGTSDRRPVCDVVTVQQSASKTAGESEVSEVTDGERVVLVCSSETESAKYASNPTSLPPTAPSEPPAGPHGGSITMRLPIAPTPGELVQSSTYTMVATDLGRHRLKGIQEDIAVFSITLELPCDQPALSATTPTLVVAAFSPLLAGASLVCGSGASSNVGC